MRRSCRAATRSGREPALVAELNTALPNRCGLEEETACLPPSFDQFNSRGGVLLNFVTSRGDVFASSMNGVTGGDSHGQRACDK